MGAGRCGRGRDARRARHFEDSKVPAVLPKYLPGGWKGAFVLLAVLGWQPTPKRGDPPVAPPAASAPNAVTSAAVMQTH